MNRIGRKIAAAWLAAAMAAFLAAGCGGGGNTPAQDAETSSHIGAQDKEDESDACRHAGPAGNDRAYGYPRGYYFAGADVYPCITKQNRY